MYCSLYDDGMVQHDDHFTKTRQFESIINYKYPSVTKFDANKSHQHYHLPERLESQISCSHSLQHHLLERPQSAGPGKDVTKYIRNITKLVSSHSERSYNKNTCISIYLMKSIYAYAIHILHYKLHKKATDMAPTPCLHRLRAFAHHVEAVLASGPGSLIKNPPGVRFCMKHVG